MEIITKPPISLAITGASGSLYGLRLLEQLVAAGRPVYLMISEAAREVIAVETDLVLPLNEEQCAAYLEECFFAEEGQIRVFARQDWYAPVASGSNAPEAMVICPCSTGTLSAISHGASDTLIERAADVALKERRQLILVVRETPLSTIHLSNMLELSRMGAVIMPASPGFYQRPTGVGDLVDFMVARILDHLDIPQVLLSRWGDA